MGLWEKEGGEVWGCVWRGQTVDSGSSLAPTPTQGADLRHWHWGRLPPPAKTQQLLLGEEQLLPWEGCLPLMPRGRLSHQGPPAPQLEGCKEGSSTPPQNLGWASPRKHCLVFISSSQQPAACNCMTAQLTPEKLRARECGKKICN